MSANTIQTLFRCSETADAPGVHVFYNLSDDKDADGKRPVHLRISGEIPLSLLSYTRGCLLNLTLPEQLAERLGLLAFARAENPPDEEYQS